MTVITGNIKYLSFYQSVDEMVRDKNLYKGKLVFVLEEQLIAFEICEEGEVYLDNGLYAKRYDITPKALELPTISGKVKESVGGILAGEVLRELSMEQVLTRMLFNEVHNNNIEIDLPVDKYQIAGTYVFLRTMTIRGLDKTYKIDLYKNGEHIYNTQLDQSSSEITVNFKNSISLGNTTTFLVKAYGRNNESEFSWVDEKSVTVVFEQPVFGGLFSSNKVPGITELLENKHEPREIVEFDARLNGNRVQTSGYIIIGVPRSIETKMIKDQNGFDIGEMFSRATTSLPIGGDVVVYNLYTSKWKVFFSTLEESFGIQVRLDL